MPAFFTLLIVALAAAGVTAIAIAVVLLRRNGRLDARRLVATGALLVVTGAAATGGIAALQPSHVTAPEPVAESGTAVTAEVSVDVQLPTIALDD